MNAKRSPNGCDARALRRDDDAEENIALSPANLKSQSCLSAPIADSPPSFPNLTANGFDNHRAEKLNPQQVETAKAFLLACGRSNKPTVGSYALKHEAEKWGRTARGCPYISNGAMIAAALTLGFPIKRYDSENPNAGIGVSWRGVEKVMLRTRWRR